MVQNPLKQEAVLQQQSFSKGQQQRNNYEDDGNVEEDEEEMEGEDEEEKEEEEMDYRYAGNQRRQYQDEYGVQKPPTPKQMQLI